MCDLRGHQPLVAQATNDLGFVRGVEFAGGDLTGRIDGTIAIDRHAWTFKLRA